MHLLPPAPPTSAPNLGEHLDNIILLGCGLLIIVLALALCGFIFDQLSKALESSNDWIHRRAARRRKKRTCLKKHYPPTAHRSHLRVVQPLDDTHARNALLRNADAHQAGRTSSARSGGAQMRLVKPQKKG